MKGTADSLKLSCKINLICSERVCLSIALLAFIQKGIGSNFGHTIAYPALIVSWLRAVPPRIYKSTNTTLADPS
jgi:hypothetical protein